MNSRTKSEMLNKTNNSKNGNSTRKAPFVETAILSMSDLERIKKNATILSKDDQMNNNKILEDQKQFSQASAQVNIFEIFFNFIIKK